MSFTFGETFLYKISGAVCSISAVERQIAVSCDFSVGVRLTRHQAKLSLAGLKSLMWQNKTNGKSKAVSLYEKSCSFSFL